MEKYVVVVICCIFLYLDVVYFSLFTGFTGSFKVTVAFGLVHVVFKYKFNVHDRVFLCKFSEPLLIILCVWLQR